MNKIVSFDTFRFILALCVVFGHSYVNLYKKGTSLIGVQNIAVDGFFILSGFLLALSIARNRALLDKDVNHYFLRSTWKRFCRLWPEFFFALIVVFLLNGLCLHKFDWYPIPFNLILIAQVNKVPYVVNGSWYVSVLFWGGAILSYLLMTKRKSAVSFYLPLIIFSSFGYIYSVYNHLSLHGANHFLWNTYSTGFIRGIMDMSIGMECYFISLFFQQNNLDIRASIKKSIIIFLEIAALFLVLYAWTCKGVDRRNFLVLFGYAILLVILYLRKETFLKFLSWKVWIPITQIAYMLFLTHIVWLEIIKRHIPYQDYPEVMVYASTLTFCCIFAFLCYHAQKWFFAKLKELIFVSLDDQKLEIIANQDTPPPHIPEHENILGKSK